MFVCCGVGAAGARSRRAGSTATTSCTPIRTIRRPSPRGCSTWTAILYESTGLEQHSSIRKVRLETGEVLQKLDVPAQYFGEGIVNWKSHLISLTWKSQVGFVYDLATFKPQRQFHYEGEGWALTQDGTADPHERRHPGDSPAQPARR